MMYINYERQIRKGIINFNIIVKKINALHIASDVKKI